ncbi:uncharacterized protein LOC122510878 [Leptopilina heterotoma]|uniref:uncharacterized protein LOC122510878 n=1 Tax=Leptopilina heterotoma TaxID=63436 RepID=UPI001CA93A6F|nr:uncharacterized protein LOC122510878 [Leptopilina heterotoma]
METIFQTISRTESNFKKIGKLNINESVIKGRIELLNQRWIVAQAIDLKIQIAAAKEDKQKYDYFKQAQFLRVEETYLSALDFLNLQLHNIITPVIKPGNFKPVENKGNESVNVKLPQISLPEFSGSYGDWESFRDLFSALIIKNDSLSNVTRFHYLKTALSGEAAQLVKHIVITEANFSNAWEILTTRYENNRALITAHIQSFMDISNVSSNCVDSLKSLRDTTNEALSALRNLKRPVEQWQDLLVFIISRKLDSQSLKEWEMQLGSSSEYPTYGNLNEFLSTRIRALEAIQASKSSFDKNKTSKSNLVKSHAASSKSKCLMCKENHPLFKCSQFKALPVEKQSADDIGREESSSINANQGSVNCNDTVSGLNTHSKFMGSTILATALIDVKVNNGKLHKFRVLFDQGSECCFASERAVKILKPNYDRINTLIYGVGGNSVGLAKKLAHFQFLPKEKGCKAISIEALVLYKPTSYCPPTKPNYILNSELKDLFLADPDPFSNEPIDFIVGADKFGSCLLPGLKHNVFGCLTAQPTMFGWILSGSFTVSKAPSVLSMNTSTNISNENLHDALVRFWALEEIPFVSSLTEEELKCEEYFSSNFQRLESGRYMVRLPFKNGPPINIGRSFGRAKLILERVLSRLIEKPKQLEMYREFLNEYLQLGHMCLVKESEYNDSSQIVYLPHHAVIREDSLTTILRVVFNASSLTSNNTTLNSHFLIGPPLLNDLISILIKWRMFRYVLAADAEKMFRQILIDPRDVDYQRILWKNSDGQLIIYQLLTVTYGTACAPFLANRVIKQLAQDEGENFPLAKPILEENIYVDDVFFGKDDLQDAKETKDQLVNLMKSGGFNLRKWSSNDKSLLSGCTSENHERALDEQASDSASLKVLGLKWEPSSDCFRIGVNLESINVPTKRSVLSVIAKLYDPLGWIAPVVVTAKLIMQELWLRKLDWDETLPPDLMKQWFDYYDQLESLKNLKIPRWVGAITTSSNSELHGFADASNRAYAASIYLRVIDDSNEIHTTLLISKSKIAPITPVSIPRLELCAAVLLSRVMKYVLTCLNFQEIPHFCYTDSTVVLAWLGKHPSTWKTFVANRVALINELVPQAQWHHVTTNNNAADCASRGLMPKEIVDHSLWWGGPECLSQDSKKLSNSHKLINESTELEKRTVKTHCLQSSQKVCSEITDRFSSWPKLLRVMSYCFRFINKIKNSKLKSNYESISLTTSEINQTRLFFIKLIQYESFQSELRDIGNQKALTMKSPIKNLNPFIDSEGILRLGGRLRNAPIRYDEKHPIILPKNKISHLIALHAHVRSMHGGIQLSLHTLRQNYWIVGARSVIKSIINNCITCVRQRAAVSQQLMGDLPDFRVTPSRPFSHTGVDYAGPFDVKLSPGRGCKTRKAYLALFVCCSTRAIHIELVSDGSSAAFLAAFQRFASRRGKPSNIYSDNGRNFVGADSELKQYLVKLRADNDLLDQLTSDGVSWHFIPPNAPHFGGLWEAGVKSVKYHLRRIIGLQKFTFEEFYTLLTQIEATLNSRPIAPLSEDAGDFAYLTPGHFLIGAPITSIPEPSLEFTPENRLTRWGLIQRIFQTFWKKWRIDYLQCLQKRHKWNVVKPNIRVGNMVLLRDDNLPPTHWLLGRVIECIKGSDELIRVVRVKTAKSELKRPLSKLCLLPIRSANENDL